MKSLEVLKGSELEGHSWASRIWNCQTFLQSSSAFFHYTALNENSFLYILNSILHSPSLVSNLVFLKYLNKFHLDSTIGREICTVFLY